MFSCHCEGERPKQSSFCRFDQLGSNLTETTPKVTFLALIYTFFALFLHKIALKSRVDFSQPNNGGRLKSTLPTILTCLKYTFFPQKEFLDNLDIIYKFLQKNSAKLSSKNKQKNIITFPPYVGFAVFVKMIS